jgi:glucose/arabinose dehydrogenase
MKLIIIGIAAVGLVAVGGVLLYVQQINTEQEYTACTLEAKICPDGSSVGRQGTSCEFAACPLPSELKERVLPEIVLQSGTVLFGDGSSITFQIPQEFQIAVAAEDLGRTRFMAQSPDGRLFVGDMKDLTDNSRGKIYILENFNEQTHQFEATKTYLKNLRNPNSLAFYTDVKGVHWLYVALTDELVRYKYEEGDNEPNSKPQVLATFPDYGLSYKHGGWHLTRTIAIHKDRLYVSVGSSCNSCEEKDDESERASILQMNMDGSKQSMYAEGLRNAVGLKWVGDTLYATEMGADHLGDNKPDDSMYAISDGANYGWPYCYKDQGALFYDTSQEWERKNIYCLEVSNSYAAFKAHSAPLGLEYFSMPGTDPVLNNTFLVALHGSGNVEIGNGYEIVRVNNEGKVESFITGFLHHGDRVARPVDILQVSKDSFFFTDDFGGRIFYVYKQ